MLNVPAVYWLDAENAEPKLREYLLNEFAAAGAKYMLLSFGLFQIFEYDESQMKVIAREMANAGLQFKDAHAPFGKAIWNLNCPYESIRKDLLDVHRRCLQRAREFGVDTITVHPGNDTYIHGCPVELHLSRIYDALDYLLPEAEKCGVIINIENSMYHLNTPDKLLEIKRRYPTPYLGFCYDAGHANVMAGKSPNFQHLKNWLSLGYSEPEWDDKALEKMLDQVVTCHFHDNDGVCDRHLGIGHGNVDWRQVTGLLKTAPRLKSILCEVKAVANRVPVAEVCKKMQEVMSL